MCLSSLSRLAITTMLSISALSGISAASYASSPQPTWPPTSKPQPTATTTRTISLLSGSPINLSSATTPNVSSLVLIRFSNGDTQNIQINGNRSSGDAAATCRSLNNAFMTTKQSNNWLVPSSYPQNSGVMITGARDFHYKSPPFAPLVSCRLGATSPVTFMNRPDDLQTECRVGGSGNCQIFVGPLSGSTVISVRAQSMRRDANTPCGITTVQTQGKKTIAYNPPPPPPPLKEGATQVERTKHFLDEVAWSKAANAYELSFKRQICSSAASVDQICAQAGVGDLPVGIFGPSNNNHNLNCRDL